MGFSVPAITRSKYARYARPLICVTHRADMVMAGATMDGEDDVDDERFRMVGGGWTTPYVPSTYRTDILGEHQHGHRVVIHARGFYHVDGCDGAWEMETEVAPQMYALVTAQQSGRRFYLQAYYFHEGSRLIDGGSFDLTRAAEHVQRITDKRSAYSPILQGDRADSEWNRPWVMVPKKDVPGRMRQVLHAVDEDLSRFLTANFGRKPGYFAIRRR